MDNEIYLLENPIIAYCSYCHHPVYEADSYICDNGEYYHYDKENPLLNCYFPEKMDL